MLNVHFSKKELEQLKNKSYYVEQEKDIITIRNIQGVPVGEIVYIEDSNTIVLMSKTQYYFFESIDGIHEYFGNVYVNFVTTEGGYGQIRLQ